jgi:hypothetical protein
LSARRIVQLARSIGFDQSANAANFLVFTFYMLVSVLFCGLYFRMTDEWSIADFKAFAYWSGDYPGEVPIFRYRVLTALLSRGIAHLPGVSLDLAFQCLAVVFVFGLIVVYRLYLSNLLSPALAAVFSLGIVYPMLWNLCLLNRLYYPFDIPSLFFFTLGCHCIYRRHWPVYYVVLILATLNRETSCFLVFAFLFCLVGKMPARNFLWHLLGQGVMWTGINSLMYLSLGADPRVFRLFHLSCNVRAVSNITSLSGSGPKDLAKVALAFGGVW